MGKGAQFHDVSNNISLGLDLELVPLAHVHVFINMLLLRLQHY